MGLFNLPSPRLLLRLVRAQERTAAALERIADVYAGPIIPGVVAPPAKEPVEVAEPERYDPGHVYEEELKLTALLGREPTADELVHHLDAQEFAGDEETTVPAVLRARANGGRIQ